jgi:predicted site-specific integrase-resolvase
LLNLEDAVEDTEIGKEWTLHQGVNPENGYRWFRNGTLPLSARRTRRLILAEPALAPVAAAAAVYARVSSAGQKADLGGRSRE